MAKSFNEIWAKLNNDLKPFKKNVPVLIGKEAQRFFTSSFNNQGFTDQSLQKWKPRMYDKKKKDIWRAILVKTGDLRRSVSRSMKSATWEKIVFNIDLPYAQVHNEGFHGSIQPHKRSHTITKKVRGGFQGTAVKRKTETLRIRGVDSLVQFHDRNVPKRQFIGHSVELNKKVLDILNKSLAKLFASK